MKFHGADWLKNVVFPAVGGYDIVLNLAYVALFASTFARSIVWLRMALIAAAIAFIVYGSLTGIVSMVIWNIVIGSLHCVQQFKHLRARSLVTITSDDERFRQLLFPDLDEFDFYSLWSIGETVAVTDAQLTFVGQPPGAVWVVLDGIVEVRTANDTIEHLPVGSLIGEMSYLSGGPASADTFARSDVALRRWPQGSLRSLGELNPRASRAMFEAISNDLGRKLSWRTFWA